MEQLIGSLEPGKRADLILMDIARSHNAPRFRREPEGIYAQSVYAGHAHDVTDVMVNGQWVMRDGQLLTLDETALLTQAEDYARRIDQFLMHGEHSVLSKLIAIGGRAVEGESFEVQAKARIADPATVWPGSASPRSKFCITVIITSMTHTSPSPTLIRVSHVTVRPIYGCRRWGERRALPADAARTGP